MIRNLENPSTPTPDHADVCIVGAGAAGILLAVTLANAGRKVLLLEGGGLHLEHESQQLYDSEVVGHPYQGIHSGRFRTYGGTTTEWGGQILELDDIDFTARPHVPGSGWPFSKSELRPYYDRAARAEGLSRSLPGDAKGRNTLLERLRIPDLALGPDFAFPFSRWCPQRNFAVLHKRTLEGSLNLSVYLHGNVVAIHLNDDRTAIRAMRVRTLKGRDFSISAENFVLCMGGIETTRLLLQPMAQSPPPWQTNGLLGKYYQDHISCDCIPIRDISARPLSRYFGFVASRGFQYQTKLQLAVPQQMHHKTLNVAGSINPWEQSNPERENAARALRRLRGGRNVLPLRYVLGAVRHLPAVVMNWLLHHLFGGALAWRKTMLRVHCEQSPLSASSITLAGGRDSLGMFRTRIDWRISPHEISSIRTYVWLAEQRFLETGFARVDPPPGFFTDDSVVLALCSDSNHHMGSTRMSVMAADGIVDPNLRLHGIANGYICSASVFPSCGFSNPTHTVLALALRLADRLIAYPRQGAAVNHDVNASRQVESGYPSHALDLTRRSN